MLVVSVVIILVVGEVLMLRHEPHEARDVHLLCKVLDV